MIKTKFSRIPAEKKNMAPENVANDAENTTYNKMSTLAIFHVVQAAQRQLHEQNMNVDVSFIRTILLQSIEIMIFIRKFQIHN